MQNAKARCKCKIQRQNTKEIKGGSATKIFGKNVGSEGIPKLKNPTGKPGDPGPELTNPQFRDCGLAACPAGWN